MDDVVIGEMAKDDAITTITIILGTATITEIGTTTITEIAFVVIVGTIIEGKAKFLFWGKEGYL